MRDIGSRARNLHNKPRRAERHLFTTDKRRRRRRQQRIIDTGRESLISNRRSSKRRRTWAHGWTKIVDLQGAVGGHQVIDHTVSISRRLERGFSDCSSARARRFSAARRSIVDMSNSCSARRAARPICTYSDLRFARCARNREI